MESHEVGWQTNGKRSQDRDLLHDGRPLENWKGCGQAKMFGDIAVSWDHAWKYK